jgi:hypothetical protein
VVWAVVIGHIPRIASFLLRVFAVTDSLISRDSDQRFHRKAIRVN